MKVIQSLMIEMGVCLVVVTKAIIVIQEQTFVCTKDQGIEERGRPTHIGLFGSKFVYLHRDVILECGMLRLSSYAENLSYKAKG